MEVRNNTHPVTNDATLVFSGRDYFERLEQMILNSKFEIHIQTYIFNNDFIGKKILEALKTAASRNVKIFLLTDSFGSDDLPEKVIAELKSVHINFRFFSPLFSINTINIGRRLHHKLVVADAKFILIGGINIADKYYGSETETPWLDYAVLLENSKLGSQLQELCRAIYSKKWKPGNTVLRIHSNSNISILQNDWLKSEKEIHKAYIKNIKKAKKEIIIVGSYFLPGKKIIHALEAASLNKVNIKLILSGITDVPLAKGAASYFYSKLLRNNIEIYEWNKSVLHGKTAVIDRHWTTIGSFNLNNLSSYGSIEMNVAIDSESFAENYLAHLEQIISQCQQITSETIKIKFSWRTKLSNWVSFWLARFLFTVVTYLPYKRFLKIS